MEEYANVNIPCVSCYYRLNSSNLEMWFIQI
jgi:hypothetical protein